MIVEKSILLKFSGPLQSWGTESHFETRYTDLYPSKSAVLGLLAASMGYRRDDPRIEELKKLKFAVRVDQRGEVERDYHIAQKYKKNGDFDRVYVTNRYYLQDAVFVVALSSDDEFLGLIDKSIQKPYFQLFLGRRAFPITADYYLGLQDGDPICVLEHFKWQAAEWYKKKSNSKKVAVYADANLLSGKIGVREHKLRRDEIVSFSQKHRQFELRKEAMIYVSLDDEKSEIEEYEHNAFRLLEG